MDNPVAKALHDGLDTLRERGLAQWQLCDDDDGRVCARGGLLIGAGRSPSGWWRVDDETIRAADRLLCAVAVEQYPERCDRDIREAVAYVNNHDDTMQEDVERIYEKAIVKAYETL